MLSNMRCLHCRALTRAWMRVAAPGPCLRRLVTQRRSLRPRMKRCMRATGLLRACVRSRCWISTRMACRCSSGEAAGWYCGGGTRMASDRGATLSGSSMSPLTRSWSDTRWLSRATRLTSWEGGE